MYLQMCSQIMKYTDPIIILQKSLLNNQKIIIIMHCTIMSCVNWNLNSVTYLLQTLRTWLWFSTRRLFVTTSNALQLSSRNKYRCSFFSSTRLLCTWNCEIDDWLTLYCILIYTARGDVFHLGCKICICYVASCHNPFLVMISNPCSAWQIK